MTPDHQIGPELTFAGNLTVRGVTHFEGKLRGQARGGVDATLLLSPHGHIEGEVEVQCLVVGGRVHGPVRADRIRVRPGGVIEGDVACRELSIEAGGVVLGALVTGKGVHVQH